MNCPDTTSPTPDPAALRALVGWFAANGRDLPWRASGTSAWGVLLSEVMSQQTPVARVAPIGREWMGRWPTPEDFADASRAEVLRAGPGRKAPSTRRRCTRRTLVSTTGTLAPKWKQATARAV